MFGIGMPELIVIFVIALLVFGPKELPKIGRTIGKAMGEFRRASDELREGIQREMDLAGREEPEAAPTSGAAPAETAPAAALEEAHLPAPEEPASQSPPETLAATDPAPVTPEASGEAKPAVTPPEPPPQGETGSPAPAQPAETRNA